MRKSDYPQYYGGARYSRGPRTFRYWFHIISEFYPKVSKFRKRWLMIQWLVSDCEELSERRRLLFK